MQPTPLTDATSDYVLDALKAALPADRFPDLSPKYLEEPRGRWAAQAGLLVAPRATSEVATVVKIAAQHHVGIVPYGGGTGLVGGQIMGDGPAPIILTLERMTDIRAVFPDENVMIAEAGVILADLQATAADRDRLFPLSLASEGSARLGGLLATNAGGVNVIRYGNTRDLTLGLEVVLPNGEIWNGLSRLRKDNTGYDLRHLMIGSEGTLGIITAASLKLSPIPSQSGTAIFTVPDPTAALGLLSCAKAHLGEGVSAFEMIHKQGLRFLRETMPDVRLPFEHDPDWFVLMDVGLAKGLNATSALETLFQDAFAKGLATDGLIAQSKAQAQEFWNVRESIPLANRKIGSVSSHDISLPLSAVPEFITAGNAAIAELGALRINCFGHLGDGNLHYNVFPDADKTRADYEYLRDAIKTTVHDLAHSMGGSVSAEHGIGRLKVGDVQKYSDPARVLTMQAIKNALDPKGIMNPGVLLPNTRSMKDM